MEIWVVSMWHGVCMWSPVVGITSSIFSHDSERTEVTTGSLILAAVRGAVRRVAIQCCCCGWWEVNDAEKTFSQTIPWLTVGGGCGVY